MKICYRASGGKSRKPGVARGRGDRRRPS